MIVDDEPLARSLLTQYVAKVPSLELIQACSNPLEALDVLRESSIDLLLLDIQMPDLTGINLLKILPKKPLVILTTAYSEYALEGYELDVIDYLLKPITLERFLKAIEKVIHRLTTQNPIPNVSPNSNPVLEKALAVTEPSQSFLFVKDGSKLVKVKLQEILYVEGLKDYVAIHTPNKKIVTLQRIKSLETQLPETHFIRIHNSYIVALEWIDAIFKEKVQIGSTLLPISDTYRKAFKAFIDKNNPLLES
jgi:DNA-binding LytR/AlgR family response regulator